MKRSLDRMGKKFGVVVPAARCATNYWRRLSACTAAIARIVRDTPAAHLSSTRSSKLRPSGSYAGPWRPSRSAVLMVRTTSIAAANARLRFGVTTGAARRSDSFALARLTTRAPFDRISTFTLARRRRGLGSPRAHRPLGTIMTPKRSGRRRACSD